MKPEERAEIISHLLNAFTESRQGLQNLSAVRDEIKEAEQEAYARGFADAMEKAAKVAEEAQPSVGLIRPIAERIRALKPE